jgi:hypothetical protein
MLECCQKLANGILVENIIANAVDVDWDNNNLEDILSQKNLTVEKLAWAIFGCRKILNQKNDNWKTYSNEEFINILRECQNLDTFSTKNDNKSSGTSTIPQPDEKKKPNIKNPFGM